MDVSKFPTKANLLKALSDLKLSKQGYEMLDRKRSILITEMMALIDRVSELQKEIEITFTQSYEALQRANISLGISKVRQIGVSIPEEKNIDVKLRSVMGVWVPKVIIEKPEGSKPRYSFFDTDFTMDDAYLKFNKLKILIIEMAEVENTVVRLADNISKTQKRANSLKTVIIPDIEKLVEFIRNSLEEKEREEFSRLSVLKKRSG